ncbi:hypothetical protein EXIGLDRAFT_708432 [Exidia glandulosa HHB12029]|uniref:F-box domain-containing protein n=1 Tax=Exidia glandulosa HHB12029 TaxID=1314781 RepID=A0A166N5F2_EXIGL|nr:hypothetical protein EXIGLDRAFT_708432 [Exidia glandulosa HHB12029]
MSQSAQFSAMPEDVLFALFREMVDAEDAERHRNVLPQTNFRLAAVSRTWRRVALDCPRLWRQITVDARHLRNSDDLARHLERVETLIKRARGTMTHLTVAHFPGSSWTLMEYYMFWCLAFVHTLQTASVLALEIDSSTGSPERRAAINDILSVVANCEAPLLRAAVIASHGRNLHDGVYNSALPHFLANGRFRHLTIIGIELRPSFILRSSLGLTTPLSSTNSLTTLNLRSGCCTIDVGAIIHNHRHSLQQLSLDDYDVLVPLASGVELDCLPRLASLTVRGRSLHFLPRLHRTVMPSLQCVSTGGGILSAAMFRSFLVAHQTESIRTLTLSMSKGHGLGFFALPMTMDYLRFVIIMGHVEPDFFRGWTELISAAQAQSLDTVEIHYNQCLDCCAIAMIRFFAKQRELCNGKTTATLDLRPNGPDVDYTMPMHFWATRALTGLVFVKLNGVAVRTRLLSGRALADLFAGVGLVKRRVILAAILLIMCLLSSFYVGVRWFIRHIFQDALREGVGSWIAAANAISALRIITRAIR